MTVGVWWVVKVGECPGVRENLLSEAKSEGLLFQLNRQIDVR